MNALKETKKKHLLAILKYLYLLEHKDKESNNSFHLMQSVLDIFLHLINHFLLQLQNDVKMIHQGCYFTYQQDSTYYLYINEVGIGSSYFYKDEPLYGRSGIMGEIGLISLKGKTINQQIRECQNQEEFNEILSLLLSMVFTMIDPKRLELSLDLKWRYEENIIEKVLNEINQSCFENLYFHEDVSSMLFDGLVYRGVVYLLKERIERNEKI